MLQRGNFTRLLDAPEFLNQAIRRLKRNPSPLVLQAGSKIKACRPRLDAYARSKFLQQGRYIPGNIPAINQGSVFGPELFRGLLVPAIRSQPILAVPGDDQAPGAFVELRVMQFKARKIEAIFIIAYQKRVKIFARHRLSQFFPSGAINGRHVERLHFSDLLCVKYFNHLGQF